MSFTPVQWFLAVIAVLGVLSGATAQLTDLFGAKVAENIATVASLLSSIISAVLMPLTGQSAQIKAVAAMPGVDRVVLNEHASQVAAQVAVDPGQPKVGGATAAVQDTLKTVAKGA